MNSMYKTEKQILSNNIATGFAIASYIILALIVITLIAFVWGASVGKVLITLCILIAFTFVSYLWFDTYANDPYVS